MTSFYANLTNRERVIKVIEEVFGGSATVKQVDQFLKQVDPSYKDSTYTKLTTNTVNVNRGYWSYNQYPRRTDDITNKHNVYDKLFKIGSQYVLYDPKEHGVWEIYQEERNGKVKWLTRQVIQDETQQLQDEFNKAVKESLNLSPEERKKRLKNVSSTIPVAKQVLSTVFVRNPDVVAEVLHRAKGFCEKCYNPAPFQRAKDGTPYLEVHHIQPLAKGGEDTVKNAIALCPNCHRQQHYG